jgi:hypothetical protein
MLPVIQACSATKKKKINYGMPLETGIDVRPLKLVHYNWKHLIVAFCRIKTLVSFNLSINTEELYLYSQRHYFMRKVALLE